MSERLKYFPNEADAKKSFVLEHAPLRKPSEAAFEVFSRIFTGGIEVQGRENIPDDFAKAPYIVTANHMGWAEAPILQKVLSQRCIHWMTKRGNFDNPLFGLILHNLGHFPVNRGKVDRVAFGTALYLLKKGKILGMLPEGTRGRGGKLGKLKEARTGTALLAVVARAPIITTAVWGSERLLPLIEKVGIRPQDLKELRTVRPEVHVRIGKLFTQHREQELADLDKEKLEKLTTNLMLEIRDMLPREYHGYYAGMEPQPL